MRFVAVTELEHQRLVAVLRGLLHDGLGDNDGRLIRRIVHAPRVRVPPRLVPADVPPCARGPHRRIVSRLLTEQGTDALLLSCGHLIGRATGNQRGAYCEACLHTQGIDEEDAPPLMAAGEFLDAVAAAIEDDLAMVVAIEGQHHLGADVIAELLSIVQRLREIPR